MSRRLNLADHLEQVKTWYHRQCTILLPWILHLPPSAVPLVSYVRLCRPAQRSARLT